MTASTQFTAAPPQSQRQRFFRPGKCITKLSQGDNNLGQGIYSLGDVILTFYISKCYNTSVILPPMRFRALQENLRKALWERIEEGELTGLRLAEQTGFKQAHICSFIK